MNIAGYIKTSLIEWPGKIASVIFVQGCNFKCPFCHNRDLVKWQSGKVAKFQSFKEEEILTDLEKRKGWVEAVVVTGGEPTLQTDLLKFLKELKKLKLLIAIHTNGSNPEVLKKLLEEKLLDFIAMDLKGDLGDYGKYIGVQSSKFKVQSNSSKLKVSLDLIVNSRVEYEFRTTVVPGLHDIKNLICLAEQIKFLVQSSKACPELAEGFKVQSCRWFLQQFRPMNCLDKKYLQIKPYSKEEMEGFCRTLKEIIPQTSLRGV